MIPHREDNILSWIQLLAPFLVSSWRGANQRRNKVKISKISQYDQRYIEKGLKNNGRVLFMSLKVVHIEKSWFKVLEISLKQKSMPMLSYGKI